MSIVFLYISIIYFQLSVTFRMTWGQLKKWAASGIWQAWSTGLPGIESGMGKQTCQ
jgi:hypothetical protein